MDPQTTFRSLTGYQVADGKRHWGKVVDVLMEYPTCKNLYLGVFAHMGAGAKEIWAPVEKMIGCDHKNHLIQMPGDIDQDLVPKMERLQMPRGDRDELRLNQLFKTRPAWVRNHFDKNGKKKKFRLRKTSRLLRLSELLGWDVMLHDGSWGNLIDILLSDDKLELRGFEAKCQSEDDEVSVTLNWDQPFQMDPGERMVYFDAA